MKNIKAFTALLLALCMCVSLGACGGSGNANAASSGNAAGASQASSDGSSAPYITLKWADHNSDGCPVALSIDEMAEKINTATEGRVKIEPYHGGTLGTGADGLSMLETGVCDLVWTSTAFFAGQFPYTEILQQPMLGIPDSIRGTDIFWDLNEEFADEFAAEYEDYFLWMGGACPSTILGVRGKSISSLGDIKGLNIRAAAGSDTDVVEKWGGSPVAMAPPDLYLGLQKGVIDGYLFNGSGVHTWGLNELTDCTIDMGLGYAPFMVLMSKKAWDSLTEEDQEIFREIGGRAGSQIMTRYTEDEANEMFAAYSDNGAEFYRISAGDPLYEELKAPLAAILEDWISATGTQAMVDFVAGKVAE